MKSSSKDAMPFQSGLRESNEKSFVASLHDRVSRDVEVDVSLVSGRLPAVKTQIDKEPK